MNQSLYSSQSAIRNGYKDQLIHYYNIGIGGVSEISEVTITKKLIATIEKRYKQLGGILPIPKMEILRAKGKKWRL